MFWITLSGVLPPLTRYSKLIGSSIGEIADALGYDEAQFSAFEGEFHSVKPARSITNSMWQNTVVDVSQSQLNHLSLD